MSKGETATQSSQLTGLHSMATLDYRDVFRLEA
jgi:hypothetical protein